MRLHLLAAMALVSLTHTAPANSSFSAAPHLAGRSLVVEAKESKFRFTGSAKVSPSQGQRTKTPTSNESQPSTDKCHLVGGALYCRNGTGGRCYLIGGELFCN
jgi:hypothetical protein